MRLASQLPLFDAVILQRRLPTLWELASLHRQARRLIFDFDDAVFHRDSFSHKGLESRRRRSRFSAVVQVADVVVAGNAWLAERAKRAGAGYVVVVPTCVEPSAYPLAHHESQSGGLLLVWVGSSSTLRGLESARDQFDHIGKSIRNVRLKLVCDRFASFRRLPVEPCVWRASAEAAEIAAADVGISWLPDDDWTRGKCGLKVLQYMAAGLPVVANPVGVQAAMVVHGRTGFLATTPYEWVAAIRTLAEDADLRRRMGVAARQRVERDFSVEAGARRWCEILTALQGCRTAAG
jgi:glycosyltransferase involved in cell wall biosynthesis